MTISYQSAEALCLRACRCPVLKFINPFLPSPWEGDLSPSLPFPVAPARSTAGRLEAVVTHFSNICDPLGASGPSCFTMFPIFFAISAKSTQTNSLQATFDTQLCVFADFPCSRTPKIIGNHLK